MDRCVICYCTVREGRVRVQKQSSSSKDKDTKVSLEVDVESSVLFLLENLLDVEHDREELVQSKGDPSTWLKFCYPCSVWVDDGKRIYREIAQLQKDLEDLKAKVETSIKRSWTGDEAESSPDPESVCFLIRNTVVHRNDLAGAEIKLEREDDDALEEEDLFFGGGINDNDPLSCVSVNESDFECRDADAGSDNDEDGSDSDSDYNPQTEQKSKPAASVKSQFLETFHSLGSKTCGVCNKVFDRPEKMRRHYNSIHAKIPVVTCEICTKQFYRHDDFREHWKRQSCIIRKQKAEVKQSEAHKNWSLEQKTCKECGKVLSSPRHVRRHYDTQHARKTVAKCEHCNKVFYRTDRFKEHQSCCRFSGRRLGTATQSSSTDQSLSINNVQMDDSNLSGISTTCEDDAVGDNKRKGGQPVSIVRQYFDDLQYQYQCKLCKKGLTKYADGSTSSRLRHLQNTHAEVVEAAPLPPSYNASCKRTKNADGNFICDKCGRSFSSGHGLSSHSWLHLSEEEKIEQCKILGERDGDAGLAARQCPVCSQIFRKPSRMKVHLATHTKSTTGEGRICCQICDQRFYNKQTYAHHIRLHLTLLGDQWWEKYTTGESVTLVTTKDENGRITNIRPVEAFFDSSSLNSTTDAVVTLHLNDSNGSTSANEPTLDTIPSDVSGQLV